MQQNTIQPTHTAVDFLPGIASQSAGVSGSVLVVDDEPMVREVVARYLQLEGFDVQTTGDGLEAVEWLALHTPDLVVLDVMLPSIDGLTILRNLRAEGTVPVILLTSLAEEIDRVVGLEIGADDYVVKPFSARELAVRVRNVIRRSRPPTPTTDSAGMLDFGALCIDQSCRTVNVDGREIQLTPKEFDVLALLAESPRQVFSRRQLLDHVWDSSPEYQDPATVTVHVGRLRTKIESDPNEPRWVTTVWGVGYRFEP